MGANSGGSLADLLKKKAPMGTPPFNPNAPDPRANMFAGGGTAAEDWQSRMLRALGG